MVAMIKAQFYSIAIARKIILPGGIIFFDSGCLLHDVIPPFFYEFAFCYFFKERHHFVYRCRSI